MRTYGQFCPIARGSEILAERWTPIILRNLLLGCRTFNEIAAGAPGLSRALLARRLRELERAGVLEIRPKPNGRGLLLRADAGRQGPGRGPGGHRGLGRALDRADRGARRPGRRPVVVVPVPVRRDLLPDQRVVVRLEFTRGGRRVRLWLLVERREVEICRFDPGFGDDLVVGIEDPIAFARWHMGRLGLDVGAALGRDHGHRAAGVTPGLPDLELGAGGERQDPRRARPAGGGPGLAGAGWEVRAEGRGPRVAGASAGAAVGSSSAATRSSSTRRPWR